MTIDHPCYGVFENSYMRFLHADKSEVDYQWIRLSNIILLSLNERQKTSVVFHESYVFFRINLIDGKVCKIYLSVNNTIIDYRLLQISHILIFFFKSLHPGCLIIETLSLSSELKSQNLSFSLIKLKVLSQSSNSNFFLSDQTESSFLLIKLKVLSLWSNWKFFLSDQTESSFSLNKLKVFSWSNWKFSN